MNKLLNKFCLKQTRSLRYDSPTVNISQYTQIPTAMAINEVRHNEDKLLVAEAAITHI